jgi:bud site selection protein 20
VLSPANSVRLLEQEPYSQKEADAAAGIGCADFYEARELRKEQKRMEEEQRKMEIEA